MRAVALLALTLALAGCVTVEYQMPAPLFPESPAPAVATVETVDEETKEKAVQVSVACLAMYGYAQVAFEKAGEFEAAAALTPAMNFYSQALVELGYTELDEELKGRISHAMSLIAEAGLVDSVDALADPCKELME